MHSSIVTHIRSVAVLLPVCLLAWSVQQGVGYAADTSRAVPGEYQVKAAFVYNFIKFVEWPAGGNAEAETLRLCILGDVPVPAPFEDLDGKTIKGMRLAVSLMMDPQAVSACQVLFVASSLSPRISKVLDAVKGRPTLTVGDTEGYARRGIMINMYLDNKRVRFEINAKTARAAGLRVSTKLMSLAGTVYGGAETED